MSQKTKISNGVKCDFTYQHYQEILKTALKKGYKFSLFSKYNSKNKKIIFLRHDIDVFPKLALKIAQIENKLGIKATYFFLLHCPLYNPLSKDVSQLIKKLRQMKHEVGLHVWKIQHLEQEIKMAGLLWEHKVKIVSFHNPTSNILNRKFKNIISTYEPHFFSEIEYISDSSMYWLKQCFCQFLWNGRYQKLQVLTHPVFWSNKKNSNLNKMYESALSEIHHSLRDYLIKDDPRWKKMLKTLK